MDIFKGSPSKLRKKFKNSLISLFLQMDDRLEMKQGFFAYLSNYKNSKFSTFFHLNRLFYSNKFELVYISKI